MGRADDYRLRRRLDDGQRGVLVMDEEHKRRMAEGRAKYYAERKGENTMPFLKRRMDDDEVVPAEREDRTKRIVEEVRDEPEYTDNEDDAPRRAEKPAPKPSGLTIKMSAEEMKHDLAAHIAVINATSDALLRTGMPAHLAQVTTQSICAAHIQRAKDIEAVLKQYA